MDANTRARFEARAKIIKAMAHPTRLFIVDQLSRREHCVYELTAKIGADVSTVSRHLTMLKDAGIVRDDKRGNQVFYNLRVACVLEFFECVEGIMKCSARDKLNLLGQCRAR